MKAVRVVVASLLAATTSLVIATPAYADKIRNGQWQLAFLDISKVHELSQGDGIVVAVIDSGIDAQHPDLTGNVLTGADVMPGGSGNGWGDKAKILPIRIDTGAGVGAGPAMGLAVDQAVQRGAKIISISVTSMAESAYDAVCRALYSLSQVLLRA